MSKINNFIIIIGYFLLPIILFNTPNNFIILNFNDILAMIVAQSLLLILCVTMSIFSYFLFLKKFSFYFLLCINAFLFFCLFYYKPVTGYFNFLESFHPQLDNIISVLIYFITYIFLLHILKNDKKLYKKFLIYFLFLNLVFYGLNFFTFAKNKSYNEVQVSQLITFYNDLDLTKVDASKNKTNIFIIVLDGFMNLELAENYKIIDNKNSYIEILNENNFKYVKNFHSNYTSTGKSISSLLEAIYPWLPNQKKRSNENVFPNNLHDDSYNHNFFEILKKTKKNFVWIGNSWGMCLPNVFVKCFNKVSILNYIEKPKAFYVNSIYSYAFDFYINKNSGINSLDLLSNVNYYKKSVIKENTIFLMHVMSPHPPAQYKKGCKKTNAPNQYLNYNWELMKQYDSYLISYKCVLKDVLKFSKDIKKINDNSIIAIIGDHGWRFGKERMSLLEEEHNIKSEDVRYKAFLAVNSLKKCADLELPRSTVNLMRFLLNCSDDLSLKYLDNKKF